MSGQGIFSEDFSLGLGDFLEVGDDTPVPDSDGGDGGLPGDEKPKPGKDKDPFPTIESSLSASELVAKYKKALLSKQGMFKDIHQKWMEAQPATGKMLVCL